MLLPVLLREGNSPDFVPHNSCHVDFQRSRKYENLPNVNDNTTDNFCDNPTFMLTKDVEKSSEE